MIPKPFRFSLFSLVLLHSIGCAPGTSTAHKAGAQEQIKAAESDSVDYTDEIGRYVRLPKHPLRIVSLAPSVTEVLYLLGAQDRLVGVTTHCDWPEDAKTKPKIGNLLNPNYEVILAAKPDLVIATTAGNDRAAVLKLAGLGLPVFVTAPRSVEKISKRFWTLAGSRTERAKRSSLSPTCASASTR